METIRFPVGGSRQAVYDHLQSHGFVMSGFSDKEWTRADGLIINIYGTGSRAMVRHNDKGLLFDGALDDLERFMPTAHAAAYTGK